VNSKVERLEKDMLLTKTMEKKYAVVLFGQAEGRECHEDVGDLAAVLRAAGVGKGTVMHIERLGVVLGEEHKGGRPVLIEFDSWHSWIKIMRSKHGLRGGKYRIFIEEYLTKGQIKEKRGKQDLFWAWAETGAWVQWRGAEVWLNRGERSWVRVG
jgi:hypothetical protein